MGVANVADDGVKIGAPSHLVRNLGILLGAAAAIGGVWLYTSWSGKKDVAKLVGFDNFRAAYAEKCGAPDYVKEQADVVNDAYVTRPQLQTAMAKQLAVLESQGTSACFDVAKELRAIDFVVPKPGAGVQ